MEQHNKTKNYSEVDDEIDLLELLKVLWESKLKLILITSICLILGIVYSLVAPKEYKSSTSFFITSPNQGSNLGAYASVLGMSENSNLESLIENVINSFSIKESIAIKFLPLFETEVQEAILNEKLKNEQDHKINFVIKRMLKLDKKLTLSISKNGLYELQYASTNIHLVKDILNTYLDNIILFNETLELSAEKNIITIIDNPRTPLSAYKPNLILNTIVSGTLGGFISIVLILGLKLFNDTTSRMLDQ